LYDGQAYVGLLALSSRCRISKLQTLKVDERFDSRRLHHYLFYYQCFAIRKTFRTMAVQRFLEEAGTFLPHLAKGPEFGALVVKSAFFGVVVQFGYHTKTVILSRAVFQA
jgi:hypothetical protein